MDHLYFIQSDKTGMIKIGRSLNPQKRLKQLQTGNPNNLKIIYVFKKQGHLETYLHQYLDKWRCKGEWFKYQCVGAIPVNLYEQIPYGSFDDWWVG
tara:strand:- start:500 stop:787 length:288 start_codon:yes stop_codon:yes gene_type:complete